MDQARQQADRLRVLLGKAVGDQVSVTPILTFPGWLVTSRVPAGTRVLNPKNIREVVLDSRNGKLPPQLAERVAYPLEQRCRDVAL